MTSYAAVIRGDHVTTTRTHEGGEYSEVVLCKVVHTPQKKTQPNPFKDKALSTSQKNASLSCVGFAHRTPSPKTAANECIHICTSHVVPCIGELVLNAVPVYILYKRTIASICIYIYKTYTSTQETRRNTSNLEN